MRAMGEPLASLVDVIGSLVDALEASGLSYALGGAVAYSSWGEPRATRAVDLNVWVEPDELDTRPALRRSAFTVMVAAAGGESAARRPPLG
jgi:hypothetical protein